MRRERRRAQKRLHWIAGAGAGILVVASVAAFFSVDVCDQQLSSKGSVVRVCRHMQASDPPVIAAALVVLAALSVFFNEISGFGFTMKRAVEKVGDEVERLGEREQETRSLAVGAQERVHETAGDLVTLGRRVLEPVAEATDTPTQQAPDKHPLEALAERYDTIRLTLPHGAERTQRMNEIARAMRARAADEEGFDVENNLASPDGGLRLAAYLCLSQAPDPRLTKQLVNSLIDSEDTAFGRIYGLVALKEQVESDPTSLDQEARNRLATELLPRLPAGDMSVTELRQILDIPSQGH